MELLVESRKTLNSKIPETEDILMVHYEVYSMDDSEMRPNDYAPLPAIFLVLQEKVSKRYTFWFIEPTLALQRYGDQITHLVPRLEKYIHPHKIHLFLTEQKLRLTTTAERTVNWEPGGALLPEPHEITGQLDDASSSSDQNRRPGAESSRKYVPPQGRRNDDGPISPDRRESKEALTPEEASKPEIYVPPNRREKQHPVVLRPQNAYVTPPELLQMMEIVNKYGHKRHVWEGMLRGTKGEMTDKTVELVFQGGKMGFSLAEMDSDALKVSNIIWDLYLKPFGGEQLSIGFSELLESGRFFVFRKHGLVAVHASARECYIYSHSKYEKAVH